MRSRDDALNRLATVTDPSGGVYAHAYDSVGNRASLAYPNGATTTTLYDPVNRLSLLATADEGGTTIQSYAFTLDETGRRQRIDEHDGTARSYTYDPLSRLTRDRVTDAAAALVYEEEFAYDPVGNRLSFTRDDGSGPVVTGYSYDARDRLVSEGATAFTWDANGNLTAKTGIAAYGWDTQDRLTTATLTDGTEVVTQYDPDGNRVRTETTPPGGPTETVEYLVDTSNFLSHVVVESDGAGNVLTHYTRGDELLSLYRPAVGERKYFHADGIGSVRALTDVGGAVIDRYAYTAFGVLEEHTGSDPQPYRFTGEPFDPSIGFQYHRARWLGPGVGRFLSLDSFRGALSSPASLHRYLYAAAEPVGLSDASGLSFFEPSDPIFGMLVHKILEKHFRDWGLIRDRSVVTNRWLNTVLATRGVSRKGLLPIPPGNWRPDLVDVTLQQVYEIKLVASVASGYVQLAGYVRHLNSRDPGWRPGTEYRPPPGTVVSGSPVVFRGPYNGLIVYGRVPLTELAATSAALLSARMIALTGQVALRLSLGRLGALL